MYWAKISTLEVGCHALTVQQSKTSVGWHASAVSFPLSDIILAQLACPLSDAMFYLHSEITNLSLYKHSAYQSGAPRKY
jgi:hypothetical protein